MLTNGMKTLVQSLKSKGKTQKEIMNITGKSRSTIKRWWRKNEP